MWKQWLLGALMVGWSAGTGAAGELAIGDPAPKIEVKEFIKGDPVTKLEKGKTYVVEFWATWCPPCRTSIPHLTELQKKHKDITFIGVSVYESDWNAVKPFVEKMGDKMDYKVAVDEVGAGAKSSAGKMATGWMDAAEQQGIPTAFIINGDGNIAWIGHPMQMEKPLDKIAGGSWDLQAAASDFKQARVEKRKMAALSAKLTKATRDKDSKAVVAIVDEAVAADPKMENRLYFLKLNALMAHEDTQEKALEYGKHLVDSVKDNASLLNDLAWNVLDPKSNAPKVKKTAKKSDEDKDDDAKTEDAKIDPRFAKMALMAAERANEISQGKEPNIIDTLAKAYFDNGDVAKAVETQERAVTMIKGTPAEKDPGFKERLLQYQKAAKK